MEAVDGLSREDGNDGFAAPYNLRKRVERANVTRNRHCYGRDS